MTALEARLTPALVRWAYRFLLGRDPESEAVIEAWCGASTLAGLREGILISPELAGLALSDFPEKGGWIDNPPQDEALTACLMLRDGRMPGSDALQDLRARCPSLRSLRRFLLASPEIERRLPRPEGPRGRNILLLGREFSLKGDSRDPEFTSAPGMAPRFARLLRAAWPDGGAGRVLVEAGAGIGLSTLGLAAGAPDHATLIAHEASLRRAASLAENLADHDLPRACVRATDMGPVAAMLAREGLDRLDLLRLNDPGAARAVPDLAPLLGRHGTLTLVTLDLAELLGEAGPGPREVLAACRAAFPHVVAFDAAHDAHPLEGEADLGVVLHRALMRPDRRDEILLCADLDWLGRYRAG